MGCQVFIVITSGPEIKGNGFHSGNQNSFLYLSIVVVDLRDEARSTTPKHRRAFGRVFEYAFKRFGPELNRVSCIVTKNDGINSQSFGLIAYIFYGGATLTEIGFNVGDGVKLDVNGKRRGRESQNQPENK